MSTTLQLEKTKAYIQEELSILSKKLSLELADSLQRMGNINEETYYRKAGEIYQYKYIQKYVKELIYFYKKDIEETGITIEDKKNIKEFLILGNIGLVLKTLENLLPYSEREGKNMGDFITEGIKSILESIEKYEPDFTTEKTTKGTKIKLLDIDEDGIVTAEITGNKPFGDIDIELKDNEEDLNETVNVKLEWKEKEDGDYVSKVVLDSLTNHYENKKALKLKVSKKVGQPSTFFTNNVFYAIKNHLNKIEPLKISNNYYILTKQVSKIKSKYEEEFSKEPSERWLAYYLIVQNGELLNMTSSQYKVYQKKKDKIKLTEEKKIYKEISDVLAVVKKEGSSYIYLTVNKNKRRVLMIKSKAIKKKNKVNYGDFLQNLTGVEDDFLYMPEFEALLDKKEKEIKKIRLLYSGVDSLDTTLGNDESMSRYDIIKDTSSLDDLKSNLEKQYRYKEFGEKAKVVLSPREKFYVDLYFDKKLPLELLAEKGFYKSGSPGSNITEVRNILKGAMCKLLFYIKYKKNNY